MEVDKIILLIRKSKIENLKNWVAEELLYAIDTTFYHIVFPIDIA